MNVKVTMKPNWATGIEKNLKVGLLEMSLDVRRRAIVIAPKLTRALVNSGIVEPINNGYRIKFGNSQVPYARRRHYENNKNPQTKGYLAKAGDSVARGDQGKYFRGKV